MFAVIFNNKKRVEVANLEAAQAAFDAWKGNRLLSSRSYNPVIVIDIAANKAVGYFSMNGRYWTEVTADEQDWEYVVSQAKKHLVGTPAVKSETSTDALRNFLNGIK